ncbi:COX15/CtaA family protein [Litoribaculum gwangyangense]|uniref:COX15/CtaA family protein n=1 Tax=Litoribaculum gwangyangense TaxID=1130722 RepID=A0ABP9CS76_9FLAO
MKNNFRNIAKITLVLTYLVIIAGAFVRMTGSGMGCPDWPKCFGYYIPPTEHEQLKWKPNHEYKKGQVIILDESLQVAKTDFITSDVFTKSNWETYSKHDYAVFNPWHTWVEYVNRLLGALAGLATLIMAIASINYWKKNKVITLLSVFVVLGMGFQAWLGKTVVDSNLAPLKITIHMVMALVIVAAILFIIHKTNNKINNYKYNSTFKNILIFASFLTLIQIILGTHVRQFVDEQAKILGEENTSLWLNNPTITFYIHRSFSIIVLLVNGYLFYLLKRAKLNLKKLNWVVSILILEVVSGISMVYLHFPFGSQTVHLVLASILFGVQFYLVLETFNAKNIPQTL